jgi:hypothetical protein
VREYIFSPEIHALTVLCVRALWWSSKDAFRTVMWLLNEEQEITLMECVEACFRHYTVICLRSMKNITENFKSGWPPSGSRFRCGL